MQTLSSWATSSIEEVASTGPCTCFFQLYVYKDRNVAAQFVRRAKRAGFKAIAITVDTHRLGRREVECWLPRNAGDDKPALLLVHGFGTDGVIEWVHQIQALSKHYSLYIPNLLFFGRSTTTSKQRSEHFQAECLMNMMKKLGLKEWHALGTSYGGFVVFRMSHLYLKMVKKVIIASSGVCMAPSNNEILLQAFNTSHKSEILIPRTPQMTKKSLNLVLHKPNNLMPKFFYADMVEVANRNRAKKIELLDGLEIGSKESFFQNLPRGP